MEHVKQLIHQNRLKVAGAFGGIFLAIFNFFNTYEIVIRERVDPATKALVTETRTPRFEGELVVTEDVRSEGKTDWRPPIQPTNMPEPTSWAYYIRDPILAAIKASPFDLVITDTGNKERFTRADVKEMKQNNKKVMAFSSLGEAEKYRDYWKPEWDVEKPEWLGDEHKLWKGVFQVKNLLHPEWKEIVKQHIISVMDAGYDGILITGLSGPDVESFLGFIYEFIHTRNTEFRIFVQDYIEEDVLPFVDGVVKQNLIYNYGTTKLNFADRDIEKLKKIKSAGKHVLVVSYTRGSKWALAKEIAKDNGFVIYSAPIKLDVLRLNQE